MLKRLENLIVLQEKDKRLAAVRNDLSQVPQQKESIQKRWQEGEVLVNGLDQEVKAQQVAISKDELDIKTREESILRLKNQQFETKKNDEYTKLGEDVVRYQGSISALEEGVLLKLEALEVLQQKLEKATEAKVESHAKLQEEVQALVASVKNLKAREAEVLADRDQFATQVDDGDLENYGRLSKRKEGQAVVGIKANHTCSGCNIKVNSGVVVSLKKDKDLVNCDNCGRIVFLYNDYGHTSEG